MTTPEPGLFDTIPPVPATLPPATLASLEEITCEGHRAHIKKILLPVLDGTRTLESAIETISHERLPADLVVRLMHTMQGKHP